MMILLNLLQPIVPPKVPNYEDPNVIQREVAPKAVAPVAENPASQVQTPAFDPSQFLGGLMRQAPKAPTYNMQDETTLRNMAKGQKVGDLLSLLGDVYGVAKGAPVAARQFTSTAPYLQRILENRQQYQRNLEDFQNKDFARKIQMATNAAAQAKADAAAKQRAYQFEKTQSLAESKAAADAEYKDYLKEQKAEDSEFSRQKFEEQKRQFGITSKQKAARDAKIGTGKADKASKPIKIKTDKQTYTLQPEEASLYRRKAQDDPRLRAQHPEWFVQVGGTDQWDTASKAMVKKGGTYKLGDDVKDEDVARIYLEWKESPGTPAPESQLGVPSMIPSIPLLDPGYGSVGGYKKSNASTGGLY